MMDFVDLTILKPFDEEVVPLCKTHIDIGLLSNQSPYKSKLWNMIEEINTDQKNVGANPSIEMSTKLNTIEYRDVDLTNCDISLWNLDLETVESNQHILLNKQIFLIIVEPDFKFIQQNLSRIEMLKKTFTDSNMHPHIIGILLTNYGTITKKNCEKLLQIPISDFQINDPNARDKMKSILHHAVLGV
ncbi:MAG: hypothetical protein KAR20_11135 [Candidatus Heimdallarchaeota archaeon]|nr:hypothetical protein [Candidatus Heimdallarchaeota archaeon]